MHNPYLLDGWQLFANENKTTERIKKKIEFSNYFLHITETKSDWIFRLHLDGIFSNTN